MGVEPVAEAVATVRAGLDALLAADLTALDGPDIARVLADLEVQRRRLDGADVAVLTAAEERRRCGDFAHATAADLLMNQLRIDAREAVRRVRRAEDLGPRRTVTGEPLAPLLPHTAAALTAGDISAAHADVISRYTGKVDALPGITPEAIEVAERLLLDASRHDSPRGVARLGEMLLYRLDQDGREPCDRESDPRRDVTLSKRPDGRVTIRGELTPDAGALMAAYLDAAAAPATVDGVPDERTPGQRRHDALHDGFAILLRGEAVPGGGVPLTTIVRVNADQLPGGFADPSALEWDEAVPTALREAVVERLRAGSGTAGGAEGHRGCCGIGFTAHDDVLPMSWLGASLCESQVVTVVTNGDGGVLAYGRTNRLATRAQRLALAGRDGGCSFPGCTRPPAWCEAHHVVPWWDGGRTDLANLCLVCSYHHRNFERLGWAVFMVGGVPLWLAPPGIDPDQRPQRNHARHLADHELLR